jgi:hypothetical protein
VSTKLDVFSFGVLVLEIVSKRKNIEPSLPAEQLCLTLWVCSLGPYLTFMSIFFVMQICIMNLLKLNQMVSPNLLVLIQ